MDAELAWLRHVAVPMLGVREGIVVAMNGLAAILLARSIDVAPVELRALFGDEAPAVATMLRSAHPDPAPIIVPLRLADHRVPFMVGARRVSGEEGPGALWALTLTRGAMAEAAPLPTASYSPASGDAQPAPAWVGLLPAVLDQLPVAVLIEDATNVAVFVNRGFTEIFEYPLDEIAALDDWWRKLYPDPAKRERARQRWSERLAGAGPGNGPLSAYEFEITSGSGVAKQVQSHSFRLGGYVVHSYVDVSDRHRMMMDLRKLADTDALTGTLNRRSFFRRAAGLLHAGPPVAALLLDVDHFKAVNDRFGHAFGDQVLVEIAARFRAALGPEDVLARLGGEEFAVLLPGQTLDTALATAERLRRSLADAPVATPLGRHQVSLSIGVAVAAGAQAGIDELLLSADDALYAAKRAGRDCVRAAPLLAAPSAQGEGRS